MGTPTCRGFPDEDRRIGRTRVRTGSVWSAENIFAELLHSCGADVHRSGFRESQGGPDKVAFGVVPFFEGLDDDGHEAA